MLKILRPVVRGGASREDQPKMHHATDVRHLHQQVEKHRDMVACGQRTVARARRAYLDMRCRVLLFKAPSRQTTTPAIRTTAHVNGKLAGIAKRLEQSHRRLLTYSASIELESDRLDLLLAEIDQLAGAAIDAGKIQ